MQVVCHACSEVVGAGDEKGGCACSMNEGVKGADWRLNTPCKTSLTGPHWTVAVQPMGMATACYHLLAAGCTGQVKCWPGCQDVAVACDIKDMQELSPGVEHTDWEGSSRCH